LAAAETGAGSEGSKAVKLAKKLIKSAIKQQPGPQKESRGGGATGGGVDRAPGPERS